MQNQLCATDLNRVFAYCPIAIAGGLFLLSIPSARPARPAFRKKRLWLTRRTAAPR